LYNQHFRTRVLAITRFQRMVLKDIRLHEKPYFVRCDPTVISPGLTRTQPSRCSRTDYLNIPGVTLRTQSVSVVTMEHTRQCLLHREVWGFHTDADSDTSFLRRFVMPAGTSLLTFRRSVLPSSSGRNSSETNRTRKQV